MGIKERLEDLEDRVSRLERRGKPKDVLIAGLRESIRTNNEALSRANSALSAATELAEAAEDFMSEDCNVTRTRLALAISLFRGLYRG